MLSVAHMTICFIDLFLKQLAELELAPEFLCCIDECLKGRVSKILAPVERKHQLNLNVAPPARIGAEQVHYRLLATKPRVCLCLVPNTQLYASNNSYFALRSADLQSVSFIAALHIVTLSAFNLAVTPATTATNTLE